MASNYWLGTATAEAEVDILTPATVTASDTNTVVFKDPESGATLATVTAITPATPTTTTTSAAIAAAIVANTTANNLVACSGTTTVILTAKNLGVPLNITSSVTGTGSLTHSVSVANVGPSDINTSANWATGSKPAAADAVMFDARGKADVLYGLNQAASGTLGSVTATLGANYNIGQASVPVQWAVTNGAVGTTGTGAGPPRFNWDGGTTATAWNFAGGGTLSTDTPLEPYRLKGANASNSIAVSGGIVGLATSLLTDTANFPVVTIQGGTLNVSSGCSTFTGTNKGGTLNVYCNSTLITNLSGLTYTRGTSVATAIADVGGTVYLGNRPASGAAVVTLNRMGGTVDASIVGTPLTVTNYNRGPGKLVLAYPTQMTKTNQSDPFTGTQYTTETVAMA